ncbi:MAG: hypothetical protein EA381_07315 [Planctomycetaceae bacterium]|nr:MAG: hypothetical protein EA381_07315 [Planctomycetaceae bacterium]
MHGSVCALFWGPFDDITPAIVRVESRSKLNLEIPDQLILDGWDEQWTIRHFIEQCSKFVSFQNEDGQPDDSRESPS